VHPSMGLNCRTHESGRALPRSLEVRNFLMMVTRDWPGKTSRIMRGAELDRSGRRLEKDGKTGTRVKVHVDVYGTVCIKIRLIVGRTAGMCSDDQKEYCASNIRLSRGLLSTFGSSSCSLCLISHTLTFLELSSTFLHISCYQSLKFPSL
jgi:hypothetical protein